MPWIVLSLPAGALFQQQFLLLPTLIAVGLAGMILKRRSLTTLASASLLFLIIWGKVASDIYTLQAEDSALLLFQFMLVIFLLEASNTALTFDAVWTRLKGNDDLSSAARVRVMRWASAELLSLGKFITGAFGLSLALLVFGGLVSVTLNQLAFSGILALSAVVAILILLTYRREPEEATKPQG